MYRVIPYQQQYFDQVVSLLAAFWRINRELAARYFRWKYLDNPWADKVYISLLLDKDVAIGMRGAYLMPLCIGGDSERICSFFGDSFIDEARRGGNSFSRLNDQLFGMLAGDGIDIALNTTASPGVRLFSLRSGWQETDPVMTMSYRESRPENLGNSFSQVDGILDKWQREGEGWLHYTNKVYVDGLAQLASDLRRNSRIHVLKSESYLRWRFANPMGQYRFLYYFSAEGDSNLTSNRGGVGELLAFVVLAVDKVPMLTSSWIADWGARDERALRKVLELLLKINPFARLTMMHQPAGQTMNETFSGLGFEKDQVSADERLTILSRTLGTNTDSALKQSLTVLDHWTLAALNLDSV
ncbi:MAG: hypothetical protein AAF402_03700 [Pseudomonadota bacterium]